MSAGTAYHEINRNFFKIKKSNKDSYTGLMKHIQQCQQSQDPDILKEAAIIEEKLKFELLKILSK
jgi:hypothetical protein